jgi:hypothetical protein
MACRGIALRCHTTLCHSTTEPRDRIPSHALFTVNTPLGSSSHFNLSLFTLNGLKSVGVSLLNSSQTGDGSIGHFHSEPSMIASTLAFFPNPESSMILSPNLLTRGPLGCQLSYHNEMVEPSPTRYLIFPRAMLLSLSIFLHTQEQSPGVFNSQKILT